MYITEADRQLAAAEARPHTRGQYRGTGIYPVTVSGYLIGRVQRLEGRTSRGGYTVSWNAYAKLGTTDAAVESYRLAAVEGVFGEQAKKATFTRLEEI